VLPQANHCVINFRATIAVSKSGAAMPLHYSAVCRLPVITLSIVSLAAAGCGGPPTTVGPPKAAVIGKVLFQGKPLADGVIVFLDSIGDPPRRYGSGVVNGVYECDVTPGVKRVEITAMVMPTGSQKPDPGSNMKQIIPPKYNLKSTLTATVSQKTSANKFDFDLKE
jgi:hypothetical protein